MNARVNAMRNLYRNNRITKSGLKKAVTDGVITANDYRSITGEEFSES